MDTNWKVLLWVPNIVGYIRLVLCGIAAALHYQQHYTQAIAVYSLSFALDEIDGRLARKFNQTSAFGAWFDIFIDLISRGLLWTHIHPSVGYMIMVWEWLTFMAIQILFGKVWKTPPKAPSLISFLMKNNFKTLHGFYMVGSLFVLPLWYYITIYTPGLIAAWCDQSVQSVIYTALIAGRALAALAEGWYCYKFLQSLLCVEKSE